MLREFAAIGLSKYTGQVAATDLIGKMIKEGNLRGASFTKDGKNYLEVAYEMGPFQMIMRGERVSPGFFNVELAVPALKEKRGYALLEPEVFKGERDLLYIEGTEAMSLETMTLCLTDTWRYYHEPDVFQKSPITVSCYGLSTEGKVLLGIYRTKEDLEFIQQEEEFRHEMLKEAHKGSFTAMAELKNSDEVSDREVMDRLKTEDALSIYDGFFYPSEKDENCFALLGDIKQVEKLMNPYSEEWVYYLELDVLGQMLRVLINPCDLTGEPKPGRRFMGKARFYGRLDPARIILENSRQFF